MKVTVVSRSGREVLKAPVDLPDSATIADLQEAFHKRAKLSKVVIFTNESTSK